MKQAYHITLMLIVFFTFGCDSNETTEILDDPKEEATDQTPPQITASGISQNIETLTDFSFSIQDDLATETELLLDGEEIFASSQNQFDFQFNPYPIPVGSHTLRIQSRDTEGNETFETYEIEIKHLLLTYEYSVEENDRSPFKWLFFNDLDGVPLTNYQAKPGIEKIYTDQVVNNTTIFYSIANYSFDPDFFDSKNLLVTTNKIALGKNRAPISVRRIPDLVNELAITVNLQERGDGVNDFWGHGSEYRIAYNSADVFQESMGVIFDAAEEIYIRNIGSFGQVYLNGEPEKAYTYMAFPTSAGFREVTVDEVDFISAESIVPQAIPIHDPGSIIVRRYGYADELAIETNTNHLIYDVFEDQNYTVASVNMPILEELEFYRTQVKYRTDGKTYETRGFDGQLKSTMPNWALSSDIGDDSMVITADNPEVDFYSVEFKKDINLNRQDQRRMTWNYRVFGNEDESKSAPRLEIPAVITDAIGDDFFKDISDLSLSRLRAIDYDEFNSYEEVMEWVAFIQVNPTIAQTSFRQIVFPLSNETGKVRTAEVDSENFSQVE